MAAKKPGVQSSVSLKHLAANLSKSHEMSKKQTEAVLGDLVGLVTKHLKKGDRVRIGGLNVQVVREHAARMGRDPATGETTGKSAKSGRGGGVSFKKRASAGRSHEVAGKTPDGVTILRAKARPTHFTSKQIRQTISGLKRAAPV
jgi:DNA-binding protein HU-beta